MPDPVPPKVMSDEIESGGHPTSGRGSGPQDLHLIGILPVRSAGFPTCCIADFLIGRSLPKRARPVNGPSAGLETRDTADWEVCGTPAVVWRRKADTLWFETHRCI